MTCTALPFEESAIAAQHYAGPRIDDVFGFFQTMARLFTPEHQYPLAEMFCHTIGEQELDVWDGLGTVVCAPDGMVWVIFNKWAILNAQEDMFYPNRLSGGVFGSNVVDLPPILLEGGGVGPEHLFCNVGITAKMMRSNFVDISTN